MKNLQESMQLYKGYTALVLSILGFGVLLIYLYLPKNMMFSGTFETFSIIFFIISQLAALVLGFDAWTSAPGKFASIFSLLIICATMVLTF